MSANEKVAYSPEFAAMMAPCQTCENQDKRPGAFACLLPQRGERHTPENCPKLSNAGTLRRAAIKMYASGDVGPSVKLYVNIATGRAGPNETGDFIGFSGPDVVARDGELFDVLVSGDRPVSGAVYISDLTRTYTEQQIKAAFWREFHGAGELWFEYRGEKESNDATESGWESFLEELQKELDE